MGCANTFVEERNCLIINGIREKYIISNKYIYINKQYKNILCIIRNTSKILIYEIFVVFLHRKNNTYAYENKN